MIKTLNIRIPDNLKKDLESISRAEHVSVSALVRESLVKLIAVKQFRQIRKKLTPLAKKEGYITDEDVFKDVS